MAGQLLKAARSGKITATTIKAGANVNARDKEGKTALNYDKTIKTIKK